MMLQVTTLFNVTNQYHCCKQFVDVHSSLHRGVLQQLRLMTVSAEDENTNSLVTY